MASTHEVSWPCNHVIIIYELTKYLWLPSSAGYIQWEVTFHKVKRTFDHVVLKGPLKNWICYISTTTRPMTTKLGKVVTYYEKLPLIKPYNPLNMWSRDRLKTYHHYYNSYVDHDSQSDYIQWGASYNKDKRPIDHVVLRGYMTRDTRAMFNKLGKVESSYNGFPGIKSHSSLKMRSHKVTWH